MLSQPCRAARGGSCTRPAKSKNRLREIDGYISDLENGTNNFANFLHAALKWDYKNFFLLTFCCENETFLFLAIFSRQNCHFSIFSFLRPISQHRLLGALRHRGSILTNTFWSVYRGVNDVPQITPHGEINDFLRNFVLPVYENSIFGQQIVVFGS